MKPLDKLTELLCENERVNEDIKELKLGCKVIYNDVILTYIKQEFKDIDDANQEYVYYFLDDTYWEFDFIYNPSQTPYHFCDMEKIKIIWNPLLERHLFMYCEDEKINIAHTCKWIQEISKWFLQPAIPYDNTKDLYEQSDSVIERILDFLIESKQW